METYTLDETLDLNNLSPSQLDMKMAPSYTSQDGTTGPLMREYHVGGPNVSAIEVRINNTPEKLDHLFVRSPRNNVTITDPQNTIFLLLSPGDNADTVFVSTNKDTSPDLLLSLYGGKDHVVLADGNNMKSPSIQISDKPFHVYPRVSIREDYSFHKEALTPRNSDPKKYFILSDSASIFFDNYRKNCIAVNPDTATLIYQAAKTEITDLRFPKDNEPLHLSDELIVPASNHYTFSADDGTNDKGDNINTDVIDEALKPLREELDTILNELEALRKNLGSAEKPEASDTTERYKKTNIIISTHDNLNSYVDNIGTLSFVGTDGKKHSLTRKDLYAIIQENGGSVTSELLLDALNTPNTSRFSYKQTNGPEAEQKSSAIGQALLNSCMVGLGM